MVLILTAIDTNQEIRNFTWLSANLETCFDVLSDLSAKGNQLLRIELIDNDKHMFLPIEAFDGTVFSKQMQILEQDWKQILSYSQE